MAESDVEAEDLPDEGTGRDRRRARLARLPASSLCSAHDGGNARSHAAPPRCPRCSRASLDLARSPATPRRLLALDVTARLLARACEGPPSNNGPPSARAERAARTAAAASAAAPAPATISAAWSAFVTPPARPSPTTVVDGASPPRRPRVSGGVAAAADGGSRAQVRRRAARRASSRSSTSALVLHGERDRASVAHAEAVASLQLCCAASELQPRSSRPNGGSRRRSARCCRRPPSAPPPACWSAA